MIKLLVDEKVISVSYIDFFFVEKGKNWNREIFFIYGYNFRIYYALQTALLVYVFKSHLFGLIRCILKSYGCIKSPNLGYVNVLNKFLDLFRKFAGDILPYPNKY